MVLVTTLGEQEGHCLTEAVDALLDVTHEEEVFPTTGHGGEQRVLSRVGVLILVHHNIRKAAGQFARQQGGCFGSGIDQQTQGFMLQIVVIQQFILPLEGGKAGGILPHQPTQGIHQRRHSRQILTALLLGAVHKGTAQSHHLLTVVTQTLYLFGDGLLHGILGGHFRQTLKGESAQGGLQLRVGGGRQPLTQVRNLAEFPLQVVSVGHDVVVSAQGARLFPQVDSVLQQHIDMVENRLHPLRLFQRLDRRIGVNLLLQPTLGIGLSLHKGIGVLDGFAQGGIVAAAVELLRQRHKGRITAAVVFLQYLL